VKRYLKAFNNYLVFFLIAAFLVTCCIMLFTNALMDSLDIVLTEENLQSAAKLTFANVILLSLIFTIFDALRRKFTVERTARRIADAAKKIVAGDFGVRVPIPSKFGNDENFREIVDCFNRMAQELSGVETLRTDFISNVSHEMKTPLAVMQNYGTMLQQPELAEKERLEYAKVIAGTCRRLAGLITNILKLNKLENQQIFPVAEEYDLSEQLCESLLQFEVQWDEKNIEIDTDIAQEVPIRADAELLSLVWSNLFSNAFKFTAPGGKVSVSLTADETFAIVTVTDTGCGMTPEVGAHIFEKFYQGDTSHATRGNGLGLALVKRVVDILRGEIGVQSAAGRGSTFTVKIRRS